MRQPIPSERSDCPDPGLLAAYAAGTLPARRREEAELHLADCSFCRVSMGTSVDLDAPARAVVRKRPSRLLPAAGIAAAALLAAGGALYWVKGDFSPHSGGKSETVPQASVWALSGELASASEPRSVLLPEGTLLTLKSHTRLKAFPAGPGERWRLHLETGEVEAAVSPGTAAARLTSPAGEIRILGTRFRAKAFQLRFPDSRQDALFVELLEGKVQLQDAAGSLILRPGARGLVLAGEPPLQREQGREWDKVLLEWARGEGAARQEPAFRLLAATLWGEGGVDGASWSDLARKGSTPELRKAALSLMELCASAQELEEAKGETPR